MTAGMPADPGGAQRTLDDVPDRGEEGEPGDHSRDEAEGHLDDPVAQLTEVIDERHPAVRVLLPPGAHETLADDAGALKGTGWSRHDRSRREVVDLGLGGRFDGRGGVGRLVLVQAAD